MRDLTPDDLEALLATEQTPQGYTWLAVVDVCCSVVGVSRARACELVTGAKGPRFSRRVPAPAARRLAFAVLKALGRYSYEGIGEVWGGLDHSSVMECRAVPAGVVADVVARLAQLYPAALDARGPGVAATSPASVVRMEVA